MNEKRGVCSNLGFTLLLLVASSCSDPREDEDDDVADDEAGTSSTDSTESDETDESGTSLDDTTTDESTDTETADDSTTESCGGELYTATSIPPNMLIVQDRSGSMDEKIDGESKWNIAKAAIEQVVTSYEDEVRFGLMLYPGTDDGCDEGENCGPGNIFVDVGPGTATDIIDALAASDTCSLGTPTAETLEPLQDYPGLEDVERPNYILLITDGQSTCDDPVPEVEALRLESPEIKTFVVGFGGGVDEDELNDMAEAGGTALQGDPTYYQADDAQALADAFADIAGNVLSCSYVLDEVPPDPDKLYIYIDDMLIERDESHADGWDYDSMTQQLTFYGPACEQLQSGQVNDLEIIFGCPMVG